MQGQKTAHTLLLTSQYVARGKVRVIVYYKPNKALRAKAQELKLVFDILEEATRNQKQAIYGI